MKKKKPNAKLDLIPKSMIPKRGGITRIPPGVVVLDEMGLMPIVDGLQAEFPGLAKSTVWRWSQGRDAGGTGGIVPSRYHLPLLRLAQQLRCDLTPDDLVIGRSAE